MAGGRGGGAQGSMPSGGQLRASPGAPDAKRTAGARGVTCCMGAGRGSPGIQKSVKTDGNMTTKILFKGRERSTCPQRRSVWLILRMFVDGHTGK